VLAEGAIFGLQVFGPKFGRFDDVRIAVENSKSLVRHD
jgi:hypothetical protein